MLRRIPPLIMILLLFAVYGFLLQLISDPVNTLIIIGLSALIFYLVSNYLKSGRFLPAGSKRPPQAKQRQKAAASRPPVKKQGHPPRKQHPFQVIDGNKGKPNQKQSQSDQDSSNNIYP
ncbi:hypothetical protein [Brevibacillus sp. H7]|uniref:hypothetical protein n=1 Tax=Brevibacillus sp. H7 TaxID=3349138 RepID=UPI0038022F0E